MTAAGGRSRSASRTSRWKTRSAASPASASAVRARGAPVAWAWASSLAAIRTSVASSVTLRPAASTPPSSSFAVYEPDGRRPARSAIVAHRVSSQAKPWPRLPAGPSGIEAAPGVAVAGRAGRVAPGGAARPRRSQARSRRSSSTWPLVSPLRHSRSREREWKWTWPVARVAASASRSIQASIRTRPSARSWTIAGSRPRSAPASWAVRAPDVMRPLGAEADRQSGCGHRGLDRADRRDPAMEDRGGKDGVGADRRGSPATKSAGPAAPPEAMTGTGTWSADGAEQLRVEAGAGTVPVDRGHQQLAGPELDRARGPGQDIEPGSVAAAPGPGNPALGSGGPRGRRRSRRPPPGGRSASRSD